MGEDKNKKDIEKVDGTENIEKEELKDSEVKSIEEVEASEKKNKKEKEKVSHSKKTSSNFVKNAKAQKRRKAIIIWAIIIILGVAGFLFVKNKLSQAKRMQEFASASNQETATVEKKTLKKTVSATGTLLSKKGQTVSTILQSSSKIVSVNVEVGDYVEEGEVLVIFSTEDIEKQIDQTKEDIATQKKTDAIEAADTQRTYVYQYETTANTLESDAQSVENALKKLYEACDGYGDAKRQRQAAIDDGTYEQKKEQLENAVTQAYQNEQSAKESYESAIQKQAQSLSSSQNNLSSADSSYQKAAIQAGSKVKEYERTLEKLNDNLDSYVVSAPISGVVTQINVSEGNSFSNGTVLTIQDMSNFDVDINVDEYEIYSVKKAFEEAAAAGENLDVVIKTEATEDDEFLGHVKSIAPTSTTTASYSTSTSTSNSATSAMTNSSSSTPQFDVKVELDDMSDVFMVGMTAKVAIIVEESPEDSLCVPYNAVDENSDGEFIVHVADSKGGMPDFNKDSDSDSGIVVENPSSDKSSGNKPSGAPSGMPGDMPSGGPSSKSSGIFSFLKSSDEDFTASKTTYHDVTVKKLFDTDYYTAVVPVNANDLKEGDTVVIVTTKSGSNSMSMFGGMGGGPGGDMGGGPR